MDVLEEQSVSQPVMQLGVVTIADDVVLNYIRKPSNDIIFTLREIDDKVRDISTSFFRA